jgi:hypothetical protein
MDDTLICYGKNCPIKDKCSRYTAKEAGIDQTYFTLTPFDHQEDKCDEFWSNKINYKDVMI